MPGVNFTAVRDAVSMSDVLRLLDFRLTSRCGDQWRGACPVHGSNSPRSRSFSVDVRRGRYHCFRCGAHGNALDLWAAVRRLPLPEAAIELCERLGVPIPWVTRW